MKPQTLQVLVIVDSSSPKCQAQCGADWSNAASQNELTSAMKGRFGEQVLASFIDLVGESTGELPAVRRLRDSGQLAPPLILIDGEPRIEGYFDIRMALDVVEVALEMRG